MIEVVLGLQRLPKIILTIEYLYKPSFKMLKKPTQAICNLIEKDLSNLDSTVSASQKYFVLFGIKPDDRSPVVPSGLQQIC